MTRYLVWRLLLFYAIIFWIVFFVTAVYMLQ